MYPDVTFTPYNRFFKLRRSLYHCKRATPNNNNSALVEAEINKILNKCNKIKKQKFI